jgi:hypothetical protein
MSRIFRSYYLLALVCELLLVSGCTSSTSTDQTTVQSCPYNRYFDLPYTTSIPSAVSTTYGVTLPSDGSFYGVTDYSSTGGIPYFFIGPSSATCTVVYGGDGSEDMVATDGNNNATVYEELSPSGESIGYEDACAALPDLASLILQDTGESCLPAGIAASTDLTKSYVPDSVDVSMAQGAHIGLSKMPQGGAPPNLPIWPSASSQYPTWQLSVVDLWTDEGSPGFFVRSIACAVPQSDASLCIASFDYFLAETVETDGLTLPDQSSIDGLIKDQIGD